jgi:tetratricopeptide (TPR) repeat protein
MLGVAGFTCAGASFILNQTSSKRSIRIGLVFGIPLLLLSIVSYDRVGVWQNSLTLWNDAVIKSPKSSRSWGNLGDAYDSANQFNNAQSAYAQGLKLNPSDIQILYNWGVMSLATGDTEKSYELLKQLQQLSPNHIRGLVALGDIYVQRLNFLEAEKVYLRAYSLQSEATQVLIKLGNLYMILGRLDLAKNYFSKIEVQGGDDPEIAYQLLCVESMAGQVNEALYWLEKTLIRGYRDHYRLMNNEELTTVRNDDRFNLLLQRYFPDQKPKGTKAKGDVVKLVYLTTSSRLWLSVRIANR